jgi:hypothetical protein
MNFFHDQIVDFDRVTRQLRGAISRGDWKVLIGDQKFIDWMGKQTRRAK